MNVRYLVLECRRIVRSARFLVFSVVMPAGMFVLLAGIYGGGDARYADGVPVGTAMMVSMAAFGAMTATLSTGARVAVERGGGWHRQLRLTPMGSGTYLVTKLIVALLVALPSIVLVSLIGVLFEGVSLDGTGWLATTLGVWAGAVPFAAIGLLLGLTVPADSIAPLMGISSTFLGFLGGMWIPPQIAPDWMTAVMKISPSFWLTRLGQAAVTDHADVVTAVVVLAAWTAGAGLLCARRFAVTARRA